MPDGKPQDDPRASRPVEAQTAWLVGELEPSVLERAVLTTPTHESFGIGDSVSRVSDLAGATQILRSLADARNGSLHDLWVQLPLSSRGQIDMRIYPVSGSATAVHVVVGVHATRADRREVVWSVAVDSDSAVGDVADVSCSIEIEQGDGSFRTAFEESRQGRDANEVAALVRGHAAQVAAAGTAWLE